MKPNRLRKAGFGLAILVIATLVAPGLVAAEALRPVRSAALADGDTWQSQPGWPEISYSVSGVTLDPPTIDGGTRVHTGFLQPGGTLRVSGSAKFHPTGTGVYPLMFSADVNVDGKTDKVSWGRTDVKAPGDWSQSFDLSVPIPAHPVSGGFAIVVDWGDWVFDGDGVSGMFTGPPPLCDEAAGFFAMDAQKVADTPSGMLVSYDALNKGFEDAVAAYKKAHGDNSVSVSPGTSPYLAGKWLFGYGGGSGGDAAAARKEFSFTDPGGKVSDAVTDAQNNGKLYSGAWQAPAGTEASLVQDMVRATSNGTHKLSPGEVFGLALGQTGGDGRKAFLLAHNALRGLARGSDGDQAVSGIGTDLGFFDKYLQPVRDLQPHQDRKEDPGDSSGAWYHIFGTGFYHLQTYGRDDSGVAATAASVVSVPAYAFVMWAWPDENRQRNQYGARLDSVLDSLRQFNQSAGFKNLGVDLGATPWDAFSLAAEQAYREKGGSVASDPAKFCFNVYGVKIATAFHNGFPKLRPVPDLTGSSGYTPPPVDDSTVRLNGGGSPGDFTWERNGQTLTLDHKTGALTGALELTVVPVYEASNQTYGALWVDTADNPVTVTFKATDAGTLHLESADLTTNEVRAYGAPVAAGDSLTYSQPEGATQPVLTDKDGKAIEPAQGSLKSDTMVNIAIFVGFMALAVGLVVLGWRRKGRASTAGVHESGPTAV